MGLIESVAGVQDFLQPKNGTGQTTSGSVSFMNTLKNGIQGMTEDMDAIFQEAAARYQVPVKLLQAVAKAESNFNSKAVSHAGAIGVMQLMPGTARSLGVSDPYDARQNIMGGAKYLKENLDRFQDVSLALAAYNAGPNRVKEYGGIPPFQETQNYVKKVLGYMGDSALKAGRTVTTGAEGHETYSLLQTMNSGSILSGGIGSGTGVYNGIPLLASLTDQLSITQEGDNIVMNKESFASLIQLMRIQMMMNADREVGAINL